MAPSKRHAAAAPLLWLLCHQQLPFCGRWRMWGSPKILALCWDVRPKQKEVVLYLWYEHCYGAFYWSCVWWQVSFVLLTYVIALLMLFFLLLFSYLIVSVACWFSRLLNNAFMYRHDTFCDKIYRHLIVLTCGSWGVYLQVTSCSWISLKALNIN
jgi:hypothetical protein